MPNIADSKMCSAKSGSNEPTPEQATFSHPATEGAHVYRSVDQVHRLNRRCSRQRCGPRTPGALRHVVRSTSCAHQSRRECDRRRLFLRFPARAHGTSRRRRERPHGARRVRLPLQPNLENIGAAGRHDLRPMKSGLAGRTNAASRSARVGFSSAGSSRNTTDMRRSA